MNPHPSPRTKRPEKLKQKQRMLSLSLPKANQILSPELPFALHKRASVRSQLTAVTQDTQSTTSDVLSDVVARKVNDPDDDEEEEVSKVRASTSEKPVAAFFIPGITGKARCLQSDPEMTKPQVQPDAELIEEKASIAESSRASTKRSEKSSRSRTSNGDSRASSRDDRSTDDSMDSAGMLYGAVVESIQARRKEGLTDLGEEEFQRMLSLLQHDAEEPSLRQQVTSIRRLLSELRTKGVAEAKEDEANARILMFHNQLF